MSATLGLERLTQTDGGCLEYSGARSKQGYGSVWFNGRSMQAHRVAWEQVHGPIPVGMFVCHRCDNPPCCNPDHLFLGSAAENNRDRMEKGRGTRGERVPGARLTAGQVRQIRRDRRRYSLRELAERYGVAKSTVCNVATGKTWRHVA